MRRRWLTIAVILTVPSGCDNVTWGGVDVHLQAPPGRGGTDSRPVAPKAPRASSSAPARPAGPLLFAGTRSGDSATLAVVGELRGDTLHALVSTDTAASRERLTRGPLAPGTELVLFAEGVRVGRLTVAGSGVDKGFCDPRATVTGPVEIVPAAADARRLMALPTATAGARPYAPYHAYAHDYDQRVASLNLAVAAIPRVGASWPPSLLETRADMQAFRLSGNDAIAATFVYKDRLAVGEPSTGAWSLFLIGTDQQGTYREGYVSYRPADEQGKGAPRFFDHLDWNGDGAPEILLDVFGAHGRWFEALGNRGGHWVETFQDPCGAPEAGR
jgi:hypothetical protein